jgi:ABC-type sugar transport system ATPase subunit
MASAGMAAPEIIAMVFQNYALYLHMKVYENMAFSLKVRKEKPTTIAARVENAAKILGLTPYLKRYPRQVYRLAVDEFDPGHDTMVVLRHGGSDRGEGDTGVAERTGELVAMFRERHEFKPGETVHLRPRAALAHIFDRESGKRL